MAQKGLCASVIGLCLLEGSALLAQTGTTPAQNVTAGASKRASGTFDVKMTPAAGVEGTIASGRLFGDKVFHGDLVGTSRGEMWTAETGVEGSAGYVAIEKVEGTLSGRKGTFTLLHQGTMRRGGDFRIAIVVVPESGTGDLAGLDGRMSIVIEAGKHSYEMEYTLPDGGRVP
jgi:hypothetical protein